VWDVVPYTSTAFDPKHAAAAFYHSGDGVRLRAGLN
jgi:hypothetical protein